jgi:transcriptional regulator with XRE-family HTH domain
MLESSTLTKQLNKIPMLLSQKELRDGRRYIQQDMVKGTGLSKSMISRVLDHNDISSLTYESAKAIAKWLGVSMEELGQDADEA